VIAASLFALLQHVSWFVGLYWAVVTVTTVGYGDVVPHGVAARVLAMATMLVVIPLLAATFADWAAAITTLHLRRLFGMASFTTTNHWIILGYAPFIPHLLPQLLDRHPEVVMIADIDAQHLPDHPGMHLVAGDPTNPHILAKAQLTQAAQILIVGATDGDVLMTAIEAHRIASSVPMLAVAQRSNAVQALHDLGVDAIDQQSWLNQVILDRLEADATAGALDPTDSPA
jgi:voltage-gated potassium channel